MIAAASLLVVTAAAKAQTRLDLGEGVEVGRPPALGPKGSGEWFVDVAAEVGLDFVHDNGMSGSLYYPEVVGAGAALLDYDRDGDLDLYLVQGGRLGPDAGARSSAARDRLLRNDLVVVADGSRRLSFSDVTEECGIDGRGYGMGVATGDVDNDGFVDLYVTNFGPNRLWRNNADGTFREATEESGSGDERWSIAATFLDFDRDGWLDLMVVNYLDFSYQVHKVCLSERGDENYCHPSQYRPVPDRLLRNRGDGTFEDVTDRAGLAGNYGSGLGVVADDFNGDGLSDLYVANDAMPNQLWLNRGDGSFVDEALLGGCALNGEGRAEASMGVDAADYDADGDPDLFVTHLFRETNTLYRNDGGAFFRDVTVGSGLEGPSYRYTGFGTAWVDYDNDGWLDLVVGNGAVSFPAAVDRRVRPYPLDEPNQLFRNLGNGRFAEVTEQAGAVFRLSEVSRAVVPGDVDNDGDTDLLITNNSGRPRLLLNRVGQGSHWLGLELRAGGEKTRSLPGASGAIGARVAVERRGEPTLWRRVRTGGSYAAARDPRVLVGLGEGAQVEAVRVHWLDGSVEEWGSAGGPGERHLQPDRYNTLTAGSGKRVE